MSRLGNWLAAVVIGAAISYLAVKSFEGQSVEQQQRQATDQLAAEDSQRFEEEERPQPVVFSDEQERLFDQARIRMVQQQLRARDITDPRVLQAMQRVPRHRFVPANSSDQAYSDHPLPIGHGQTISQPYIVALMTQLARLEPKSRVLDIGTGSGYQAAVLGELVDRVYSIEILQPLADGARKRLADLGYQNIEVRCGDGYRGWPKHAPFDAIILAAAPNHIPEPLVDQLARGGRLILPVGRNGVYQSLMVVEKRNDGSITKRSAALVAFVPMTGEAQSDR